MDAALESRRQGRLERLDKRLRGAGGGQLKETTNALGIVPLRSKPQVPTVNPKVAPHARRSSSRRISRTPPAVNGDPTGLASPAKRQKLDHPILTATPLRDRPTMLNRSPERHISGSPQRRPLSQQGGIEKAQYPAISQSTAAAIASIGETSLSHAAQPSNDVSETPASSRPKKPAVASVTPVRGAKRRRQPSPDKFLTPAKTRVNLSAGPVVAPEEDISPSKSETPRLEQADENENTTVSKSADDLNAQHVTSPVHARKPPSEIDVMIESPSTTPEDMTPTKGSVRRSTRRSTASNDQTPSQLLSARISQQLTPETAEHTAAEEEEEEPTPTPVAVPATEKKRRGRPPRKSQEELPAEPEVAQETPVRVDEPEEVVEVAADDTIADETMADETVIEEVAADETVIEEETPSKAQTPKRRGRPPQRMLSLPPPEQDIPVVPEDNVPLEDNAPVEEDAASVSSLEQDQSYNADESILPAEIEALMDEKAEAADEEADEEIEETVQRKGKQPAGRRKKSAQQRKSTAHVSKRAAPASKKPLRESRGSGEEETGEPIPFTVYRPIQSGKFKQKFGGVSAVDVIAQSALETIADNLSKLQRRRGDAQSKEDKKRLRMVVKALDAFGDQTELQFLKQTKEYDDHKVLLDYNRKTERKKAALSRELLDIRKERELIAREADDVRKTHELNSASAENRRRLDREFQALEGVVDRGTRIQEKEKLAGGEITNHGLGFPEPVLGLSATISTLAQDLSSASGSGGGALEQVREFNKFLEAAIRAVESMSTK